MKKINGADRAPFERPRLTEVPLSAVWPPRPGAAYVTMTADQWDVLLQVAYDLQWVVLEVDEEERPVRAYRRGGVPS
jgi:hypothetical protein